MGAKHRPAVERFWDKVHANGPRSGDCWEWQGHRNRHGYGQMRLSNPMRGTLVHRFSWEIHNGPIPNGLNVLHRCDNPPCVNPAHLFLGTQADNGADMVAKGRAAGPIRFGESNHQAKLTEVSVRELRRRRAEGEQLKPLAAAFGISPSQVKVIVRGRAWPHVA